MPVVRVYKIFPRLLLAVFMICSLTPALVEVWKMLYETKANGAVRLLMRLAEDVYRFQEDIAFTILWPVPRFYLSPAIRALAVLAVYALLRTTAYELYLYINGYPIYWIFLMHPQSPHRRGEIVCCIFCKMVYKYCHQEGEVEHNAPCICPHCLMPMENCGQD